MNILTIILIFIFVSIGTGFANEIKVFNFTKDELSNLEVRKVRGADNKTTYKLGFNDNGNFLKAIADNGASGLGKEIKIEEARKEYQKLITAGWQLTEPKW